MLLTRIVRVATGSRLNFEWMLVTICMVDQCISSLKGVSAVNLPLFFWRGYGWCSCASSFCFQHKPCWAECFSVRPGSCRVPKPAGAEGAWGWGSVDLPGPTNVGSSSGAVAPCSPSLSTGTGVTALHKDRSGSCPSVGQRCLPPPDITE